ncbi:MAG: GntR family transcriptional regulator [Virgibacillus proomii]
MTLRCNKQCYLTRIQVKKLIQSVLTIIYYIVYDISTMENQSITKKQRAYDYMKSRIIEGYYAPGQRIVINQLVKELFTSAIPIREAVRQLEAEGLIEYQNNIGPIVTPINKDEYFNTMSVLAVMEGYGTALSSQHGITKEKLAELSEKNNQMKEAIDEFNFQNFGRLNRAFHELIYAHCKNTFLVDEIRRLWIKLDSIRRAGSAFHPKRALASIEEHEQLIELLRKRADFEIIEKVARMHKLNTRDAFKDQSNFVQDRVFF